MKIAVIGAGIAGLTAARELAHHNEVHLFEAAPEAGGHAHTVEIVDDDQCFPVDMGFIVYNERNYPLFTKLLGELGVETAASSMGFSVYCPATGLQYSGNGLDALLARRRNLIDRRFWGIVAGAAIFARVGRREMEADTHRNLRDFCHAHRLPSSFISHYLLPMAGAIWSTAIEDVWDFPARTLLRFFDNHGLLNLRDRPAWRTIRGGSRAYVEALLRDTTAEVHLGTPVECVHRSEPGALLRVEGETLRFDEVVFAVHSDQALSLLDDPSDQERDILGAIRYRENATVLHTDIRLLPPNRRAWTCWNVRLDGERGIGVTYLMNHLQPLPSSRPWCVTLNRTEQIDPGTIIQHKSFAHPQLDAAAVSAQERWAEISGVRATHYCGAYWRYGFHEDGAWSGHRVAESRVPESRGRE